MSKQNNTTVLAIGLSVLSLCCWRAPAGGTPARDTGKSIQYVMYVGSNDKDVCCKA